MPPCPGSITTTAGWAISFTDNNNSDKKTRQPLTTYRFEDERFFSNQKIAAHSKCEDRVLLERPVGGNAKKYRSARRLECAMIIVTGGSGKAGRACITELLAHNYEVASVDLVRPPDVPVPFSRMTSAASNPVVMATETVRLRKSVTSNSGSPARVPTR
jgi:hypothetical protein